MEVRIRKTNRNEFFQTENLTRETFWNLYQSGCTEHFLLHNFRKSKAWVEELGFNGMILFGNPNYYPRFGFKNAEEFNITTKEGMNFDPFMALELRDKGLSAVHGKFFLDDSAEFDEQELARYEEQFPSKHKGEPKIKITV